MKYIDTSPMGVNYNPLLYEGDSMIKREFSGEIHKADVLMMASEIVSNDSQIVIAYSRQEENGKVAVIEDNYVFDDGYYCNTTHWYYKTSSGVRNSTKNYLSLEKMVEEIVEYVNGDFEDGESIRVFIETL